MLDNKLSMFCVFLKGACTNEMDKKNYSNQKKISLSFKFYSEIRAYKYDGKFITGVERSECFATFSMKRSTLSQAVSMLKQMVQKDL